MAFERVETEVSAVALELDLINEEVSWIDMAVTAEIDGALDTAGGGVVTVELDLDTGWRGWAELDVVPDERTVAAEFERETEGKARGSRVLEVEGALDNGVGN